MPLKWLIHTYQSNHDVVILTFDWDTRPTYVGHCWISQTRPALLNFVQRFWAVSGRQWKLRATLYQKKICKYNFYTVTKYLEQCWLRNDQYIKSENLDPPNILKDRPFYSVVILFILSVSLLRSLLKNSINCKKGASIDIKYVLKITGFLFWDFVTSNWFLFVVSYLFCAFKKKHRLKHCKNCMLFEVFKYLSELFLFKFYLSGWTLTALICMFTRVLGKQNLITQADNK